MEGNQDSEDDDDKTFDYGEDFDDEQMSSDVTTTSSPFYTISHHPIQPNYIPTFKNVLRTENVRYTPGPPFMVTRKNKQRRPKDAYQLWVEENREIFVEKYPGLGKGGLRQKLCKCWGEMTKEERKYYTAKGMEEYYKKNPPKTKGAQKVRKNSQRRQMFETNGAYVDYVEGTYAQRIDNINKSKPISKPFVQPQHLQNIPAMHAPNPKEFLQWASVQNPYAPIPTTFHQKRFPLIYQYPSSHILTDQQQQNTSNTWVQPDHLAFGHAPVFPVQLLPGGQFQKNPQK